MYERLKFLSPSFSQVKKKQVVPVQLSSQELYPLTSLLRTKQSQFCKKTKLIFGYQIDVTFNHQIAE